MANESLIFSDINNTEDKSVLGVLEGPCADFIDSTRNNRHYSEKLWENVFKSDLVKELIDNGGIPGELDHPEDREETCSERIAILLKEIPKKKDGKLWARFSILNTPLGRIAYTLAKAGFKYGISSRGSGDIIEGFSGREEVDPSTYEFKAFDLVLIPAVKDARLSLVTESLNRKFDYKKALLEQLNSSSEEEKILMKDTLNTLGINLSEGIQYKGYDMVITQSGVHLRKSNGDFVMEFPTEQEAKEWVDENSKINESVTYCGYEVNLANSGVILSKGEFSKMFTSLDDAVEFAKNNPLNESQDSSISKDVNIEKEDEKEEADNDGEDLVVELQETLQTNVELKSLVKVLQEKLSVCYAKEKRVEGQISTYKTSIRSLQENVKKVSVLESKVTSLNDQLSEVTKARNSEKKEYESTLSKLTENLDSIKSSYSEKMEKTKDVVNSLMDKIETLQNENTSLTEQLKTVKNSKEVSINTLKESYSRKESSLNEKLASIEKDSKLKAKRFDEKLRLAEDEINKYKSIAQKAIDKYITEKCSALGISSEDVKNRLGSSYSFNDINRICESLSANKLAISKLPFNTSRVSKIKVEESNEHPAMKNLDNSGDRIDSQLLSMIDRMH